MSARTSRTFRARASGAVEPTPRIDVEAVRLDADRKHLGAEFHRASGATLRPRQFGQSTDAAQPRPGKVREVRADIGIALDGDADRVLIIDEMGKPVDGDQ